jgi:hypothetical protein
MDINVKEELPRLALALQKSGLNIPRAVEICNAALAEIERLEQRSDAAIGCLRITRRLLNEEVERLDRVLSQRLFQDLP